MEKRLFFLVKFYEENNKFNVECVCVFFFKIIKMWCFIEENNLYCDYLLWMKGWLDNDMVVLYGLFIYEFGRGYLLVCLISEFDVIDVYYKI